MSAGKERTFVRRRYCVGKAGGGMIGWGIRGILWLIALLLLPILFIFVGPGEYRKGDEVLIKRRNGGHVIRRVWKGMETYVLICTEEEYNSAIEEKREADVWPIPKGDIEGLGEPSGVMESMESGEYPTVAPLGKSAGFDRWYV